MSQSSVALNLTAALAGLIANVKSNTTTSTGINAESSAEMPFGIVVALDLTSTASPQPVKLPTAATDRFAGVVAYQAMSQDQLGTTGVEPTNPLLLLEEGDIWVTVENAVTKGARCYVRITANGGNTQLGKFRSDADSSNAIEFKGATYMTSATAGNLALVRFSMMAHRATQST